MILRGNAKDTMCSICRWCVYTNAAFCDVGVACGLAAPAPQYAGTMHCMALPLAVLVPPPGIGARAPERNLQYRSEAQPLGGAISRVPITHRWLCFWQALNPQVVIVLYHSDWPICSPTVLCFVLSLCHSLVGAIAQQ